MQLRQLLKERAPSFVRSSVAAARSLLAQPPIENDALHDYVFNASSNLKPRLSLVIPEISSRHAAGGMTTGIDFFLEVGRKSGVDLRVILDSFQEGSDLKVLNDHARRLGIDPATIEVVPRIRRTPAIDTRKMDVFLSFNCWTTLNLRSLIKQQVEYFQIKQPPLLMLIQDYEPQFYPFSSAHMLARSAFESKASWGIFNTSQLFEYFKIQSHAVDRSFVFEPHLAATMRPFLDCANPEKVRRLLVYGRPGIPRNCFPALEKGLKRWVEIYPGFADWEIVSAGLPHRPMPLGRGATLKSLGKLSLQDYAGVLRTSGVGVSLMSSPHPSYPPLEMAHFGVLTVTNGYANKDLSRVHDNIISIEDIGPDALAEAIADACRRFDRAPGAAWSAASHMPSFVQSDTFECVDALVDALVTDVWTEKRVHPASDVRVAGAMLR